MFMAPGDLGGHLSLPVLPPHLRPVHMKHKPTPLHSLPALVLCGLHEAGLFLCVCVGGGVYVWHSLMLWIPALAHQKPGLTHLNWLDAPVSLVLCGLSLEYLESKVNLSLSQLWATRLHWLSALLLRVWAISSIQRTFNPVGHYSQHPEQHFS